MIEAYEPGKSPEFLSFSNEVMVIGHTYQPDRTALKPASGTRMDMVSDINEKRIYGECYKPIFVDRDTLPVGFQFSFYRSLRDWFKSVHPQEFQKVVGKINALPNKEYQVLSDPAIHSILPLQSREDQVLLMGIGKKAFEDDLGFTPKGLWLPETAVAKTTLEVASEVGYDFVVLRDNQLQSFETNPMRIDLSDGKKISVVHFNAGLNQSMSFIPEKTINADRFLDDTYKIGSWPVIAGSDTELHGHHKVNRDQFLIYLCKPETLQMHGLRPFNVKSALGRRDIQTTQVFENSSWTCVNNLGRWTGECNDHGANDRVNNDKRSFYQALKSYGAEINARLDDQSSNWREEFAEFFLGNRDQMFNPNIAPSIKKEDGLFWAKYCQLMGMTSCGWYFGDENSPEREIPRTMISEIEQLMPDIKEHTVFENKAA
jgi:hypothetical protein